MVIENRSFHVAKIQLLISTAAFFSFMVFGGCGPIDKLDEMKTTTGEMNQTTKDLRDKTAEMKDGLDKMSKSTDEMNKQTKELGALTEEVKNGTETLFQAMRQGDTSGLRRIGIREILTEKTLQGRVAEAGLFLQGFEFQVLGTVGKDKDQTFRESLYHQALLEFFLRIDELAPADGEIWPDANPSTTDDDENRASAFNAIAFALHQVNRQQLPDNSYGHPMSIYDLIIVALEMRPDIDSGRIVLPPGPHYIKEILGHEARVRQLLQTRYNMFAYAMLGSTTNLSEFSKVRQALKLLSRMDVDMTKSSRGAAFLQRIDEELLTHAVRTVDDMLNVGVEPKLTKMTSFVLSRVDFQFDRQSLLARKWRTYVSPELVVHRGSRR